LALAAYASMDFREVFNIGRGSVSSIDVTPEEVLDLGPQPQSDNAAT
jgi:hypothetical protein